MKTKTTIPESFSIDHTIMPAPQVRKAGLIAGPSGDQISKFDLRLTKPNTESIPTAALHTMEHLLAMYMREHLDDIIDCSPMGCRTGFYLIVWGDVTPATVQSALINSLRKIVKTEWPDVPGTTEKECGNYRDHSLFGAQEYSRVILEGFGDS